MTLNDCQNSYKAAHDMLEDSPEKKHFCFTVASAYGMIKNGEQVILLNQFDKSGFYASYALEENIKNLTSNFNNVYIVLLSLMNRTLYDRKIHSGCISK